MLKKASIFLIILIVIFSITGCKKNDKQLDDNDCCTCLDCLECDVCCSCEHPYLSK